MSHFIDGTVEGTSVNQYIDETLSHDHTYFGNGCNVAWNEGSTTSCDTRLAHTKDNDPETQLMGVYYNLQAISSGSGAAMTANNAVMPDTFCPLGWQLPYGGTDGDYYDISKSWRYLFELHGYVAGSGNGSKILSYPFSYVRGGNYRWGDGKLYSLDQNGDYYSISNNSQTHTHMFDIDQHNFFLDRTVRKYFGQTVRCANYYNYFVDGTVEGDNIVQEDDGYYNDHSYYGNICPNHWKDNTPPYYGGSPTACSSRTNTIFDNETLSVGSYYNSRAATAGYTDTEDPYKISRDTFCPLGWRLPYSGTGGDYYDKSRSWKYLLDSYSYGNNATGAQKIKSYPLSYIMTGWYYWHTGSLYGSETGGYYYSITAERIPNYFSFKIYNESYTYSEDEYRSYGLVLRCDSRISILNLEHNWYILKS